MTGVSGTTMSSGVMMAAYGGAGASGVNPAMQNFYGSKHGQDNAQMSGTVLTNMVKRIMGNADPSSKEYFNRLYQFMQMLGQAFPGTPAASDPNLADQWVQTVRKGGNPITQGVAAANKVAGTVNNVSGFGGGVKAVAAGWSSFVDTAKIAAGTLTGNDQAVQKPR